MNETLRQSYLEQFRPLFSQLSPADVEQFYASYQRWSLYQQLEMAQQKLAALHEQMAANTEQIEAVRPSALALATLTRLQASGVEDIDLLDRMLKHGEEWLDRTIQHLEYCEQQGVVGDDYEEWCRHALEDAFDWLNTLHAADEPALTTLETPATASETDAPVLNDGNQPASNQTTEELLLQKLMSEDIEASQPEETAPRLATVQPLTAPITNDAETQSPAPVAASGDEALPLDSNEEIVGQQPLASIAATEIADNTLPPDNAIEMADNDNEIVGTQFIAPAAGMGSAETPEQNPTIIEPQKQEKTASRRPHFLRRLLLALWR